jgi:hypothetical protein
MASNLSRWLLVGVAASGLAAPFAAQADVAASCNVAVDHLVNGNLVEQYTKDFVVQEGVAFFDDFSTPTRFKQFRATVARQGRDVVVAIDYFSDVSALNSTEFDTTLTLRGGGGTESATGRHTFSTSTSLGFFRHATHHTLVCAKA